MRAIWKGTISFGLVSIPISLVSTKQGKELKFNMLDSEDSSRIRYLRVNENTGEEVPWERIVKGYEFEPGEYVLLTDEDFERVEAEGTRTIDIESFVNAEDIDPIFFETPYFVLPDKGGEKPYLLLRQVMKKAKKVGIARIVMRGKESLAALFDHEEALVLNLLRFKEEIRPAEDLDIPENARISEKEMDLAEQLLQSMTEKWDPDQYKDEYQAKLKKFIEEKIASGDTAISEISPEAEPVGTPAEDIWETLLQSIAEKNEQAGKKEKTSTKKTPAKSKKKTTA
ncbi:MAG: Ku protein [Anaerolineaceae bacterium]|nr:Ku protein [Anaerolineaceae bacterium]MDD4042585.1 Ku protein [Anaerolineaceae bacterium]MDD4577230.1 Ku protein [Anaerolineaceae bacterium]